MPVTKVVAYALFHDGEHVFIVGIPIFPEKVSCDCGVTRTLVTQLFFLCSNNRVSMPTATRVHSLSKILKCLNFCFVY